MLLVRCIEVGGSGRGRPRHLDHDTGGDRPGRGQQEAGDDETGRMTDHGDSGIEGRRADGGAFVREARRGAPYFILDAAWSETRQGIVLSTPDPTR
jgi:hypothetical protein